ncbi:leucine-rich repeat protein SHOC-2-like [Wyeomyia smithii]|uniref:leucine-rich repeat protein SHOC-2-like n=1 Tax=Wyeomyia smithii TaxID=174621 RepID=UPI002467FDEA|nr:leucine-rich repeat protein SHOC-2-like [Wyeomyia smithii]
MKFQLILLSTLFFNPSREEDAPPVLQCKRPKSSICTLQDVRYVDFRLPLLPNLDDKRTVQIRSGEIPRFSKELSLKLSNVTTVQLGHLKIQSLWLGSTIRHLSAEGNLIQTLVVEEKVADKSTEGNEAALEFQMVTLNLENNKLRNIRELKSFSSLVELCLDGNQLEFIEMEIFSSMKKLKKLSLARNRISKISASELIELPSLGWLSLAHNNLTTMGVKNFRMTHLAELYLSHNDLVNLDSENFDQFVSLEKLAIASNSWSCYWLVKALKLIEKKFVTLIDQDPNCEMMLIEGICCSMTGVTDDSPSFADLAERIAAFEKSQNMKFSELQQRVEEVNQNWFEELTVLDETIARKEAYLKELLDPNDDNRVSEDDISKLRDLMGKLEDKTNELQQLGEAHSKVAQHFTQLLYSTWEQKNKLISHGKNITDLKNEMERYKDSFSANFM